MIPNLKVNAAALLDTMFGLIPCKVLSIDGKSPLASSNVKVDVEITKTKGPYKEGERVRRSSLWVFPVKAAVRAEGGVKIHLYSVNL